MSTRQRQSHWYNENTIRLGARENDEGKQLEKGKFVKMLIMAEEQIPEKEQPRASTRRPTT